MTMKDIRPKQDLAALGEEMHQFINRLFPICRSITGEGLRQTLAAIGERIPLQIHEIPSRTPVLDWTVPLEWNIRDAYIKNSTGDRIVDFSQSSLHVVNYSVPVHRRMRLAELRDHLHTLPDHPEWVPYRTSYYTPEWGFCLSHQTLLELNDEEEYEVRIDSSLEEGSLTFGECYLEGETEEEVLISCHCCHPSLANDNLSGIALATALAENLHVAAHKYSYRFLFIPGTIGSITWLALNEETVGRVKAGIVVTCVGDPGPPTYKKSRGGNAEIDRATSHVLLTSGREHRIIDFSPYGYDERQYCSPGFNLPVGSLMRTPNGEYEEYHTSADDLCFVKPAYLADSLDIYLAVLDVLENNAAYVNLSPKGEPQLGKRGLYPSTGGAGPESELMARLWVLNLSDGEHTLLDIAERAGLSFEAVKQAAWTLTDGGLLREVNSQSTAHQDLH